MYIHFTYINTGQICTKGMDGKIFFHNNSISLLKMFPGRKTAVGRKNRQKKYVRHNMEPFWVPKG